MGANMNSTPSGQRVHIGFFGNRNVGKSSLVNAITNQSLAVVSDKKGTTTDPVMKSMELLPLGAVVIIDTPGLDDEGELGALRVEKTKEIIRKTDIAVLVLAAQEDVSEEEKKLLAQLREKKVPAIIVVNKIETMIQAKGEQAVKDYTEGLQKQYGVSVVPVSAKEKQGLNELKEVLGTMLSKDSNGQPLVADLVSENDMVVLVVPIDSSAPKGRLILPQQQVIRDLLEAGAASVVVKESELDHALKEFRRKPAMVITDSQVFAAVAKDTPRDIPLTSFSILMARYKGFLETAVKGVAAISNLKDGDSILIAEGCTHHRQCEDIGTVKIPKWLREKTGRELRIDTCSGREFPKDLSGYALVIHCGGCMLNEKEVNYRMQQAVEQGVPFTNYGIAIAYMKGILRRSIELFPELVRLI